MALGFHNVRFPTDVSYGSAGGPRFKTHVFTALRGFEKRNIEWCQPIMEFNAAYGIKTDQQMLNVLNFYNARQGRAFGFRYKNWANYNIVNQPFATGDGVSTRLPIWKFFGFQGARTYKRLRKIVPGSVTGVGIRAVGNMVEGVDYSINYDEGEIALNQAPGYAVPVFCANLEFDEAVRFDEDNIQAVIDGFNNQSLNQLSLVSIRGPFSSGSVFAPTQTNTTVDEFFDKTYLVLNFDDIANLTATVDQSNLAMPITFDGTATLTTSAFRNGNGSLSIGSDGRLLLPGGPYDLSLRQPWTIEFFAQQPESGQNDQLIIGKWQESNNTRCWAIRYLRNTREIQFVASTNGTDERVICTFPWSTGATGNFDYISLNHITNDWYVLRINGEVVSSRQDSAAINENNNQLVIGQMISPVTATQGPYTGLIDAIRITVGRARTTDFKVSAIPGPYSTAG